ncbi:hypothetical protein ACHAXS_013732 [Conticribra weissflogii]
MAKFLTFATAASLLAKTSAFSPSSNQKNFILSHEYSPRRLSQLFLAGGFGGISSSKSGGGGKKTRSNGKNNNKNSGNKNFSPRESERAKKQLLQRYGGDIQSGTQERIQTSLSTLPAPLQDAAKLYKEITQFEALIAPMTPADRNRLVPPIQFEMAQNDKLKLKALMEEHGYNERDLHNVYQKITWDASADAKAVNADIAGNKMKPELQDRVSRACSIAVGATLVTEESPRGKVLDVGCGHGAIVSCLVEAGLAEPDMYVGIDLSPEMIRNAVERYGEERNGRTGKGRVFVADDFFAHDFSVYSEGSEEGIFDSIIFCSSLHDLPDMEGAIAKAVSLVRPKGGKLIIVHAQGAMHVIGQHQANPVMVRRGLPTAKEWTDLIQKHSDWNVSLEHEPADPRSDGDIKNGYLAVLKKN